MLISLFFHHQEGEKHGKATPGITCPKCGNPTEVARVLQIEGGTIRHRKCKRRKCGHVIVSQEMPLATGSTLPIHSDQRSQTIQMS